MADELIGFQGGGRQKPLPIEAVLSVTTTVRFISAHYDGLAHWSGPLMRS